MDKDSTIIGTSPLDTRSTLRAALTYAAFAAGHIWAAVSAAFTVLMATLVIREAGADRVIWSFALLSFALLIAATAHLILVLWLLTNARKAKRDGTLSLQIAAWPLITCAIALFDLTWTSGWRLYNENIQYRHYNTGSIDYDCEPIAEGGLLVQSMQMTHKREGGLYSDTADYVRQWSLKFGQEPVIHPQYHPIVTGHIGGSVGMKWRATDGKIRVAALGFSDIISEFGPSDIHVFVGPEPDKKIEWNVEGSFAYVESWAEERYYCEPSPESWRPD